ncbi:hypothetical protein GA0004736_0462 [Curtobacterium sp. 9128]|uniref:hypothetical protein n=1 Tax=Curtobacterium sp. 9128 TaxID=1793722 RepID=UPI0007D72122|nr:hypothetical protein [Curtobacterium sp. 9128]SBN61575.1 hypothetical protein GA0004736_0462 [Curtobacterium sp. 9128]
MSATSTPLPPVDPRALALAEQLAEEAVAEPFRPLPRWVQNCSVAVSVVATLLALVFRVVGGDPAWIFQLVCFVGCIVAFVAGWIVGLRRGWFRAWSSPVAKPLGRQTTRRVGRAAVGRAAVPDGLDLVVLGMARQTVRLAQWQTFALPAFVLLEAGNAVVSDGVFGPWTWGFVVLAALVTALLVWTVRRERAADEVFLAGRVDQRFQSVQPAQPS